MQANDVPLNQLIIVPLQTNILRAFRAPQKEHPFGPTVYFLQFGGVYCWFGSERDPGSRAEQKQLKHAAAAL
jgi:hypothetical protein